MKGNNLKRDNGAHKLIQITDSLFYMFVQVCKNVAFFYIQDPVVSAGKSSIEDDRHDSTSGQLSSNKV